MRPLIGLTSRNKAVKGTSLNSLNSTYIEAIEKSGGLPLIIPNLDDLTYAKEIVKRIDGIVFTGGEDLSPLLFNEEPISQTTKICYKRDRMELELFKQAYKGGMPILGICRGIQVINVALGGDLYQDIDLQIENSHGHMSSFDIKGGYHSLIISKDSHLFNIFKKEKVVVNSQHHQSIKNLGKNLKVTSRSPDGVIEGIESSQGKNFILGLQFHPEAMDIGDEKFIDIFSYFIKNCSK